MTYSFFIFFFQIQHVFLCHSKVIGAAILPHGDFAYDPNLLPDNIGAKRLHEACVSVAEWIMNDMQPDLIFLTTPHGLKLNSHFLIYENDFESGNAMIGEDLHEPSFKTHKIHLDISSNKALAQKLVYLLKQLGNNVEGLSSFGKHQSLPLKWGEIIPIKYLENVDKNLPEFVIYSFPKIRHKHSIEHLLLNGFSLFDILDNEQITGDINIMIMISADLAHTHYNSKVMPYGSCDCAQSFDDAISKWIETMHRDYLLENARYQQYKGAKSCGFNGFVLLQGIFDASLQDKNKDWTSQLHANYHPTYYGMAVGNFTRIMT